MDDKQVSDPPPIQNNNNVCLRKFCYDWISLAFASKCFYKSLIILTECCRLLHMDSTSTTSRVLFLFAWSNIWFQRVLRFNAIGCLSHQVSGPIGPLVRTLAQKGARSKWYWQFKKISGFNRYKISMVLADGANRFQHVSGPIGSLARILFPKLHRNQ